MTFIEPSEIVDMDAVRVDGVTNPANGMQFLLIKSLDDDEVTEADYMAKASAKYSADDIKALGAKGQAFKNADGHYSYPIVDAADLSNAIKAVGRGGADHDAIRAYVVKRAKALGKSDQIPENWGADGSLAKEAAVDKPELAKDDGTATATPTLDQTDATIPGSSAWEAQDAEALIEAGQLLATAGSKLGMSANRERMEVATGHADDMADVYDLSDAISLVQSALSIVARVAFTEEAEAQSAGSMAKSLRSPKSAEAVRNAIGELSLLAKATDPGGAAVGSQKGATMALDITTEELGALIKSGVTEAVTEAVPAAVDAHLLAKAEADAKTAAETDTSAETKTAEELAKETATAETATETDKAADAEPTVAELIKSLQESNKEAVTEAVNAAVSPLADRVEELSKAARPGGPMVSIPGTGRGSDASTGEVDLTELEERFEKAIAGSTEKADLGERLTKMKLLHEYGVPVKAKA